MLNPVKLLLFGLNLQLFLNFISQYLFIICMDHVDTYNINHVDTYNIKIFNITFAQSC